MARHKFNSLDALMGSDFLAGLSNGSARTAASDRVLRATGLEDMIYRDLRQGDDGMDELEERCKPKLESFPALSRDVFQSFYSLDVKRNPDDALTPGARQFNAHILDELMSGQEYRAIKSVCEGEELPAYEAAGEFVEKIDQNLDQLLDSCGGDCTPELIDRLQKQRDDLCDTLQALVEQWQDTGGNSGLERKLLRTANAAESKARQVAALMERADQTFRKNRQAFSVLLASAAAAAAAKAEEVHDALVMWGGDPASPKRTLLNRVILDKVAASPVLREISRRLGRLLELVAEGKKNGYAYGRGEKYTIERGNDLSHVLSSEFAYLALPEAIPKFIRKYQRKALKQYRRRLPVYKGCGDIIMCMDNSSSTAGEDNAWGKATAMALLKVAREHGRKFALIHFSSAGCFHTDIFLPGRYGPDQMMRTAELFLDGGTDYETPLREALRLMEEEGFQNADILFTTDGECALPEAFLKELQETQAAKKFKVTGILLDQGGPGFQFSLKPFCERIYRTSELSMEQIAGEVVTSRINP